MRDSKRYRSSCGAAWPRGRTRPYSTSTVGLPSLCANPHDVTCLRVIARAIFFVVIQNTNPAVALGSAGTHFAHGAKLLLETMQADSRWTKPSGPVCRNARSKDTRGGRVNRSSTGSFRRSHTDAQSIAKDTSNAPLHAVDDRRQPLDASKDVQRIAIRRL